MRPLRRLLVLPVAGATVLIALPVVAGADAGPGANDAPTSSVAAVDESTSTTTVDPGSSEPTTTVAPSTTQVRGGIEVTRFLKELISKVDKASIAADVKTALLTRLRAALDSIKSGVIPANTDMQTLLRDVYTALGRPPGTDAPKPSTSVPVASTERPESTGPRAPESTGPRAPESTNNGNRGKSVDPAKVLGALDELTTKVTGSSLSDGDKATLVAAIDRIRQAVNAGTFKVEDLATLKAVVKAAVEKRAGGPSTTAPTTLGPTSTVEGGGPESSEPAEGSTSTETERPRPKGRDAVNAAIDLVTNAPLSDALKEQILGVLNQAKSVLDDTTLSPDQAKEKLRQLFEAEKQQRLTEAAAKLTRFSEKIATLAFNVGNLPGGSDVIVVVHDKLAEANALLAQQPLDIATIKAAWKLLHEARTTLQQFIEASSNSTTTAPPTTAAPETTTTAFETTTVPETTTSAGDTA